MRCNGTSGRETERNTGHDGQRHSERDQPDSCSAHCKRTECCTHGSGLSPASSMFSLLVGLHGRAPCQELTGNAFHVNQCALGMP